MLDRIAQGRTDLVHDWLASGKPAHTEDAQGTSLLQWCAYYGDVSALRLLLNHGEALTSLGQNFDLNGAAFHGHWQLCQFLLDQGANANFPLSVTGETPLHTALCTPNRIRHDLVLKVLLANGAHPASTTLPGIPTGSFMRDCRTKGETPLHRAAIYGNERTIMQLLAAGAPIAALDMHGDTPLAWASWHGRPDVILRLLCYGPHTIHPQRHPDGMAGYLAGEPL